MNSVSIEALPCDTQQKPLNRPALNLYHGQAQRRTSVISTRRFLLAVATLGAIFGLAIDLMLRYLV